MIERRIPPSGDPFYAAASRNPHPDEERPHGCYRGVVYIGHMAFNTETGEDVEVFEAFPCRRCEESH